MSTDRFYVTTPIYYVNDQPHIGHAYTTILADVLTRFHKLAGEATYFLTGTDEHGQKVQQAAEKAGESPQLHADKYSERFRDAWKQLNIGYDKFIRTTDPAHIAFVQGVFRKLWDKGLIYEQEYEGWYSTSEERFFTEKELVDGKDPISGRAVEKIREKNYFFKMSAYQSWLIGHIEANPDFILPDFRRNEVLGFLRQPLNDLCISRPKSRLSWGISLPFAPDFVAYVWVDALFNYQSAVDGKTFPDGSPIWPADYHLIGKDILTTHAVYWPTLLKAVDAPLPKHILAHGWWLVDNARMSKTTGNVINPWEMIARYSVDELRYFLIREMVVGQDASFTESAFIMRVNSDLANDAGNGLSRILKLASTGLGRRLTPVAAEGEEEKALAQGAAAAISAALDKVKSLKLSFAIEDVLQLIRSVNRYLEIKAPWKLAKEGEAGKAKLNAVLYHAAEALRIGFTLLHPVMPAKMEEALAALGTTPGASGLRWGAWDYSGPLAEGLNLFPRRQLDAAAQAAPMGLKTVMNPASAQGQGAADPFSLVHLKVAEVASIEDHPNADSLYVLKIRFGAEERTICAGLKKHVPKDDLLGRKVVVVYNLKPANLRGVESQGMLLAAEAEGGKLAPVDPLTAAPGDDVRLPDLPFAPKADLTLKEFDKAPISVIAGLVAYKGKALQSPKGPIQAQAPDGTAVH